LHFLSDCIENQDERNDNIPILQQVRSGHLEVRLLGSTVDYLTQETRSVSSEGSTDRLQPTAYEYGHHRRAFGCELRCQVSGSVGLKAIGAHLDQVPTTPTDSKIIEVTETFRLPPSA
jgi:hypothetical protein